MAAASWVLSECCGLRALPTKAFPRIRPVTGPSRIQALPAVGRAINPTRPLSRDWALGVSAPLKVSFLAEEGNNINGAVSEKEQAKEEFDPGSPPPFGLAEIRAAIPKHCWVKDTWRSMSYVARDVAIVAGLAVAAAHINSWAVWPLYWIAQGTMFWALFVLGHDWYDKVQFFMKSFLQGFKRFFVNWVKFSFVQRAWELFE